MKTEFRQTSPALQIPMVWVYVVFPVLGAVIILHLAAGIRATLAKV
jgi:TRAP-type C4-dicarboxylate transport system permease small subunit